MPWARMMPIACSAITRGRWQWSSTSPVSESFTSAPLCRMIGSSIPTSRAIGCAERNQRPVASVTSTPEAIASRIARRTRGVTWPPTPISVPSMSATTIRIIVARSIAPRGSYAALRGTPIANARSGPYDRVRPHDMSDEKQVRRATFPRVTKHTPLQRAFLKRLQRLAALDRYGGEHLPFSEAETALIKRSLFSVYEDLVALDCGREAKAIVRAARALKDLGDVTDRSDG